MIRCRGSCLHWTLLLATHTTIDCATTRKTWSAELSTQISSVPRMWGSKLVTHKPYKQEAKAAKTHLSLSVTLQNWSHLHHANESPGCGTLCRVDLHECH